MESIGLRPGSYEDLFGRDDKSEQEGDFQA